MRRLISERSREVMIVAAVFVFGGLGILFLTISHAATSSTASEAEDGQVAGKASSVTDTNASGGAGVVFGTGGGTSNGNSLDDRVKKEIAFELVSSAENSSLKWSDQYGYIEWNVEGNATDNRGYTGGLIGFCSGCGDMTEVVQKYTDLKPGNALEPYIPALQRQAQLGQGKTTQDGLGTAFVDAWKAAASDSKFQQAQMFILDNEYFDPAVSAAKSDGVGTLGQFIYYDAIVMHGPGDDSKSFGGIRAAAIKKAKPPAQGGDQAAYLNAFMDIRVQIMESEQAHEDVDRVENMQRKWVQAGNFNLDPPLAWTIYGDNYTINSNPTPGPGL